MLNVNLIPTGVTPSFPLLQNQALDDNQYHYETRKRNPFFSLSLQPVSWKWSNNPGHIT